MATTQYYHNLTADGSTSVWDWDGRFKGCFLVSGTFGSGTIKLQISLDGGTVWVDADSADSEASSTFTAAGVAMVELPECKLKAVLSGSTTPDLDIYFTPIIK